MSVLKWVNPFHYLVGMPVSFATWTVHKLKDLVVATWKKLPKPESFFWKCIVYPMYAYIVVPGSVPYAFIKLAEFAGYGAEMDELLHIFTGMFGSLGILAVDSAIKAVAGALWFLFTFLTHL